MIEKEKKRLKSILTKDMFVLNPFPAESARLLVLVSLSCYIEEIDR